jgi:hypothetical protein
MRCEGWKLSVHAGADSGSLHNIICFILLLQVISPEAEAVVGPVATTPMSRSQVMEGTRPHVSELDWVKFRVHFTITARWKSDSLRGLWCDASAWTNKTQNGGCQCVICVSASTGSTIYVPGSSTETFFNRWRSIGLIDQQFKVFKAKYVLGKKLNVRKLKNCDHPIWDCEVFMICHILSGTAQCRNCKNYRRVRGIC